MQAGKLRHRIIIEKKTKGRDGDGGETVTWTTDIGSWASVSPLRGQEFYSVRQVQADVTHRIRMRYKTLSASTEITPGFCRVKRCLSNSTQIFDIKSVINVDQRNIYLDLMCNERI